MYQRIMDDVIENCATTFEEDGVNQQTLDDLRKVRPFLCPYYQYNEFVPIPSSKIISISFSNHLLFVSTLFSLFSSCPFASQMAGRRFLDFQGGNAGHWELVNFWGGCRAFDSFYCTPAPISA